MAKIISVVIILLAVFTALYYYLGANEEIVSQAPIIKDMKIESETFQNGSVIPSKYTCDGDRLLNPPLAFSDVPANAKSLVLIMDDPDVPKAVRPDGVFDHWTVFNIPPTATGISEGGSVGTIGLNGGGKNSYTGPCPPPQYEPSTHRYFFRLYALDDELPLDGTATKTDVLKAIEDHILTQAELVGLYKKVK